MEETPLKRLQEQKEAEPGKVQEQSMYSKELLLSGATEFCFEELRAERYFKKMAEEGGGQRGHPSPSASVWCNFSVLYSPLFRKDFVSKNNITVLLRVFNILV